jgi:hypothetical protein
MLAPGCQTKTLAGIRMKVNEFLGHPLAIQQITANLAAFYQFFAGVIAVVSVKFVDGEVKFVCVHGLVLWQDSIFN